MSDWRELPAGRELDRVVAERLGYRKFEVSGLTGLLWAERDATGDDHPFNVHGEVTTEPICEYSTDANAALTLPLHDGYFLDLHGPCADEDKPEWIAWVEWRWADEDDDFPTFEEHADTHALAICRAWLAYTQRYTR